MSFEDEDEDEEYGRFTSIPPPLAEEGELERERVRLIGKKICSSALPCFDVVLTDGTVWAHFSHDGIHAAYRWVAKNCVLMSPEFQ